MCCGLPSPPAGGDTATHAQTQTAAATDPTAGRADHVAPAAPVDARDSRRWYDQALSDEERAAVDAYADSAHTRINRQLRNGDIDERARDHPQLSGASDYHHRLLRGPPLARPRSTASRRHCPAPRRAAADDAPAAARVSACICGCTPPSAPPSRT